MPPKVFRIESRAFPRKLDAVAFFRGMLNRYKPGDRVGDDDAADLLALLKCHTESSQKIGVGIDHFRVISNLYGTNSFELSRLDGSKDDFSYLHCITPRSY